MFNSRPGLCHQRTNKQQSTTTVSLKKLKTLKFLYPQSCEV
jgi:hypothetical protein